VPSAGKSGFDATNPLFFDDLPFKCEDSSFTMKDSTFTVDD
jgi:hypothetical protein